MDFDWMGNDWMGNDYHWDMDTLTWTFSGTGYKRSVKVCEHCISWGQTFFISCYQPIWKVGISKKKPNDSEIQSRKISIMDWWTCNKYRKWYLSFDNVVFFLNYDLSTCRDVIIFGSFGINAKEPIQSWIAHCCHVCGQSSWPQAWS